MGLTSRPRSARRRRGMRQQEESPERCSCRITHIVAPRVDQTLGPFCQQRKVMDPRPTAGAVAGRGTTDPRNFKVRQSRCCREREGNLRRAAHLCPYWCHPAYTDANLQQDRNPRHPAPPFPALHFWASHSLQAQAKEGRGGGRRAVFTCETQR